MIRNEESGAARRSAWRRPALHRMDAADAEMGLDPGTADAANMQQRPAGS